MIVCSDCGSEEVDQEVSCMIPANGSLADGIAETKPFWGDFFYCRGCEASGKIGIEKAERIEGVTL